MKVYDKSKLKSIAMCSSTIFSLFVVFMATAAWFTARRAVDNEADDFQVVCNNEIVDHIEIHTLKDTVTGEEDNPYYYNSGYVGQYTFDDPSTTKLTYHKNPNDTTGIGNYSIFEREKSLLLLYKFRDDIKYEIFSKLVFTSINLTSKENSILNFDSITGKPTKELSQDKNQLSSIVKFSVLPLTTFPTDSADFNFKSSETTINNNTKTFATIDSTKDTALVEYHDRLTLFSSTDGTKYKGFALIVSYNSDAIEYLFNINLGNLVLDNDSDAIKFDDVDFTLVL